MGFEFSGTPPAWLANPNTIKPFAAVATSMSQTNGNEHTTPQVTDSATSTMASPNSTPNPAVQGSSTGFSFSLAGQAPKLSPHVPPFGSSVKFGKQSVWSTPDSRPSGMSASLHATPPRPFDSTGSKAADETLLKALQRVSRRDRATFGGSGIMADEVVAETLMKKGLDGGKVLRALQQSPELGILTQSLFEQVLQRRSPEKRPNLNGLANTIFGTSQPPKKENEQPTEYLPDRDHWACRALVDRLAERLVDYEIMVSRDQAKALAIFMHRRLRPKDKGKADVWDIVATILGREKGDLSIRSVTSWASFEMEEFKSLHSTLPSTLETALGKSDGSFSNLLSKLKAHATVRRPARPFRFLDLPAELRNWVYEELLVSKSGCLSMQRLGDVEHFEGVKFETHYSGCHPAILVACKQIHREAKDILYQENTFMATVSAQPGTRPTLQRARFPLSMLPRLTSVVLVVDSIVDGGVFRNLPPDYVKMNWMALQSLTGLKNLRICNVERQGQSQHEDHRKYKNLLLKEIIERIPADCVLAFGAVKGIERKYLDGVVDYQNRREHVQHYQVTQALQVDGDVLKACAEGINQGIKSGDEKDYFFVDRSMKMGSLVKEGDGIDPRFVLGGGA